jgi:hypothetical protein
MEYSYKTRKDTRKTALGHVGKHSELQHLLGCKFCCIVLSDGPYSANASSRSDENFVHNFEGLTE